MPRWADLIAIGGLVLAAAPALAATPDLQPAPEATIVAAGKACVGTTVDPASQASRLFGWVPATPAQKAQMHSDGDVVTRDNVLLVYEAKADGGCVVVAKGDAAFDPAAFYPDLSAAIGMTVAPSTDGKPTQLILPNGELLLVIVAPAEGATIVTLVLAGRKAAADAAKQASGKQDAGNAANKGN